MPGSGQWPFQVAIASLLAGSMPLGLSTPLVAKTLRAGPFTFSDERGGFEILSVSGQGTEKDPVVLTERIFGTEPVTLVIRADATGADDGTVHFAGMFAFAMVKIVINDTPSSWTGFSLELQEVAGRPSGYFDGLSFDQVAQFRERLATSDRFADIGVEQEPRDRINFHSGSVTRHDRVALDFNITDMTPRREFYLIQDPEVATVMRASPRFAARTDR
ncbi:MAG: hypothetical protein U1E49_15510 [Hyphomicrobiaceae bacterium]